MLFSLKKKEFPKYEKRLKFDHLFNAFNIKLKRESTSILK